MNNLPDHTFTNAVQKDGPRMIQSDLLGWEFSCAECKTISRHDHRIDAEDEMDNHRCEDVPS